MHRVAPRRSRRDARRAERVNAVRAMQPYAGMISKKSVRSWVKNAAALMPVIPLFASRKKSMVVPYVLGGIGVALASGIAAVMWLSPRTRTRALGVAKDTYGKINEQIARTRGESAPMGATSPSNGLVDHSGYSSTGL